MANNAITLKAQDRTEFGKGAARKLRRKTLLPAATINTLLSLYTDHA